MKTIVTAAIVALSVTAPAFAQTQLERAVGAEAGALTVSQLAELKLRGSNDGANERATNFDNRRIQFSANNIHNSTAAKVFATIADETSGNF